MQNEEQSWPWPDSLDALVAAPGNHSVLLENECARVVHTRILPGHTTPVHTHRWSSVLLILTWSDVLLDHPGNVMLDTRNAFEVPKLNTPTWTVPLPPHSLKNVGDVEINTVQIEIKDAVT